MAKKGKSTIPTLTDIRVKGKAIVAFSDTHGHHESLRLPEGIDILIFAGDACEHGTAFELWAFMKWFAAQKATYKLFVPGNHDLLFDTHSDIVNDLIPEGITFKEYGRITWEGVNLYVLPARPYLHYVEIYTPLPPDIDILVTHGAPLGILDDYGEFGCNDIRNLTDEFQPRFHIFGHVHQLGGSEVTIGKTTYCNVSVYDALVKPTAAFCEPASVPIVSSQNPLSQSIAQKVFSLNSMAM